MAVSNDRKYGAGDRLFFDEDCGAFGDICPQGDASVSCGFDNNNVIACDSAGGDAWMGPDLTSFLDVLPKIAFIVVEVCTMTSTFGCFWTSKPIEFR